MRGKALTLALLLFASALAGCIGEDTEDTIDRTDDNIDLDMNTDPEMDRVEVDQESCEANGGTWVEVRDRPIDGYCDMGEDGDDRENEQEISQEDCEERGGTWHREDSGETCRRSRSLGPSNCPRRSQKEPDFLRCARNLEGHFWCFGTPLTLKGSRSERADVVTKIRETIQTPEKH